MAKRPFKPSERDLAFLDAWLHRKVTHLSGKKGFKVESNASICRKLGFPEYWLTKRLAESTPFHEWWTKQAIGSIQPRVLEVLDICHAFFTKAAESNEINVPLAKTLLNHLMPIAQTLQVQIKADEPEVEPQTPEEIEADIVAYLDDKARDVACEACGAPIVDWQRMRLGESSETTSETDESDNEANEGVE